MITIRMALAVYARCPAAYNALRSFRLLQLPSTSLLKQYKSSYTERAGEIEARLKEESDIYNQRQKEAKERGKLVPLGEGSLIFDEVKVTAKLQWNSRNNSLVGYAMSSDEMASLNDIYQYMGKDEKMSKTDYIMQTMWRDHSSNCDVIGPYYTSNGTMTAAFTYSCVMDSMRKFHAYGFKVSALICDGASSNLSLLKMLGGRCGSLGSDTAQTDKHAILTTFTNPFSGNKVFIIICPSHQLKSMISALHYSRVDGTKPNCFRQGSKAVQFGWEAIESLLARELQRVKDGQLVRVPGLKESYVHRDSWTRLNVKPAKIMQQEYVITELQEYATQIPAPIDSISVQNVVLYLKACNNIFERGILEKRGFIKSTSSPVLTSIKTGYKFFSEWADTVIDEGYALSETSQRMFLSWQTWDLLRFMFYGFTGFCEQFLQDHPGYTIYPIRLNGSAVETLFSQLKYASGGNLMSTNYASARASILVKGCVAGRNKGDDYRDAPLFVRQHQLKKVKVTALQYMTL